ncbi:MAG: hypothetical protein JSR67_03645 [Proteobacteria bacterium]|nr:hypothetical protein [Pseudomonadota bacterium]
MSVSSGTATGYTDLLTKLVAFLTAGPLSAPAQNAPTTAATGGTLAAATYYFVITALNASGETVASNERSIATTGATSTVTLSWAAVTGATGYRVYRGTAAGAESVYFAPGNVTTFTDTGAAGTAGAPPATNTAATGGGWTQLASDAGGGTYTEPQGGSISTIDADYYLKAPGLSGTEAIYVNLQAYHNVALATYNWRMRGATGYNASATFYAQPGTSPDAFLSLWNSSIPYTFVANAQRVIVIAQIGSVWESAYLGKFLPVGQPSQYPYPLMVAGTSSNPTTVYSNAGIGHHAFFDPNAAWVYWLDGSWQQFQNHDATYDTTTTVVNVWPWAFGLGNYQPSSILANLDGSYPLFRATLEMSTPAPNVLGFLDGVFFAPGQSLSSGSTITVSAQTYIAVQDVFRTGYNNFAAILEV